MNLIKHIKPNNSHKLAAIHKSLDDVLHYMGDNICNTVLVILTVIFSLSPVNYSIAEQSLVTPVLLVSSSGSDSILRYDGNTGIYIDSFVPSGSGGLNWPEGLVYGPDGNLYVSSFESDSILRYDGKTGKFIDTFVVAGRGGLNGPHGLVFGPDYNLYVSSYFSYNVLRYNGTTGAFMGVFAPNRGDVLKRKPTGLVFRPNGHLYVVSGIDILRFNGTTGDFIDIYVANQLMSGEGIVFGPDNILYVSDRRANMIRFFDGLSGKSVGNITGNKYGHIQGPSGLAFGLNNNLYISNNFSDQISRYNTSSRQYLNAFISDNNGRLKNPTFLIYTLASKNCTTPPAGLLRWWPFDENKGVVAIEIVTRDSGQLINGSTWDKGMVANALRLDGVNDSVILPDINTVNINPENSFTIEAWIKPSKGGVALFDNTGGKWASFRWVLGETDSHNDTRLGIWNGGGNTPPDLVFTRTALRKEAWHHVATVYRGNGKVQFFVDGQLDSFGSWSFGNPIAKNFSSDRTPWAGSFSGLIDELTLYNRALNISELRAIFDAGNAGKCKAPDLVKKAFTE